MRRAPELVWRVGRRVLRSRLHFRPIPRTCAPSTRATEGRLLEFKSRPARSLSELRSSTNRSPTALLLAVMLPSCATERIAWKELVLEVLEKHTRLNRAALLVLLVLFIGAVVRVPLRLYKAWKYAYYLSPPKLAWCGATLGLGLRSGTEDRDRAAHTGHPLMSLA